MTPGLALAIDVGGTTLKGELVDADGDVLVAGTAPTPRGTAAGDAFTAALAVAWGEGRDLAEAVRWAAAAGAACVRKLGASVALPHRAEIDELFEC